MNSTITITSNFWVEVIGSSIGVAFILFQSYMLYQMYKIMKMFKSKYFRDTYIFKNTAGCYEHKLFGS